MTTKSKRSKRSGKKERLISIKKLQKQCEDAWKQAVLERDGACCKVKQHYPLLASKHTRTYQADHCISRKNKTTFLLVENGTMICSGCNQAKGFNNKSIHRAVDEIVKKREGGHKFQELVDLDMAKSVNPNWSKRWWLEEQLERLNREKENIIRGRKVCEDPADDRATESFNPGNDTFDP